jgi:ubiquinone/menaquinone biosynthesis C-methylase UbiE
MIKDKLKGPVGIDGSAYSERDNHSPEPIRNAMWELIGPDAAGAALDAGSGTGGWSRRLIESNQFTRIVGVDLVNPVHPIDGVDFYALDLSTDALPCNDEELDWVFALEVLEHLANPRRFVAEAYRTLRPEGRFAVTTPCNESLTAKLSFLARGYFPQFCDYAYTISGHITPIFSIDLQRMSNEAGFSKIEFAYPLPGRMPKLSANWQQVLPRLRGRLWSDTLMAILTK